MLRRLALLVTMLLVPLSAGLGVALGAGLGVALGAGPAGAGVTKFADATDTVSCASFIGSLKMLPPVTSGGASNAVEIIVNGSLEDCQDSTGAVTSGKVTPTGSFTATVHGALYSNTNDLTNFTDACLPITAGNLFLHWDGRYWNGSAFEPLLDTSSTLSFGNPGYAQVTDQTVDLPGTQIDGSYPVWNLGGGQSCPNAGAVIGADTVPSTTPAMAVSGGFAGSNAGSSSQVSFVQGNSANAVALGQSTTNTSTTWTIGIGTVALG